MNMARSSTLWSRPVLTLVIVVLTIVDQCYAQFEGMGTQQQTQVVTNADGTTTTTVVESSSTGGYDIPFNLPMLYACVIVSVVGTYILVCCCCGCCQLCNCSPDKKTVTTTTTTTIDKMNNASNVYSMMTSRSASPEKRSGKNKMGSNDRNNDQYNNYDQYYDGQYDQFGNPVNGGGYDQYGNPLNGGHDQFSLMGAPYGQYPYSGTFDNSSLAAGGYAQPSILSDASGASMYPNSPNIPPPDENGKIVITDADIIVL